MKTNELMINDFVSYIDTFGKRKIGKVTDLHHNESWETIYVDFCDQNPEGKSKITLVRPIPLTVEILKKNGFYAYGNYPNRYFCNKDEGYCVEMSDCVCSKGDFSFCVMSHSELEPYNAAFVADCKYIHELQHALRLVGLSEIADNIKI